MWIYTRYDAMTKIDACRAHYIFYVIRTVHSSHVSTLKDLHGSKVRKEEDMKTAATSLSQRILIFLLSTKRMRLLHKLCHCMSSLRVLICVCHFFFDFTSFCLCLNSFQCFCVRCANGKWTQKKKPIAAIVTWIWYFVLFGKMNGMTLHSGSCILHHVMYMCGCTFCHCAECRHRSIIYQIERSKQILCTYPLWDMKLWQNRTREKNKRITSSECTVHVNI